jgi:hypothetical protein
MHLAALRAAGDPNRSAYNRWQVSSSMPHHRRLAIIFPVLRIFAISLCVICSSMTAAGQATGPATDTRQLVGEA